MDYMPPKEKKTAVQTESDWIFMQTSGRYMQNARTCTHKRVNDMQT